MVTAAKAATGYHNSFVFVSGLSSVSIKKSWLLVKICCFSRRCERLTGTRICDVDIKLFKEDFIGFLTWIAWSVALTSASSVPEPQEPNQPVVCPIKFHTSKLLPDMEDNPLSSSALPLLSSLCLSFHSSIPVVQAVSLYLRYPNTLQ